MRSRDDQLEGGSALIQVYTGNGKGKTTATLGLALRAAGSGLKVYIGQFIKAGDSSEAISLKRIKNIKLEGFGRAGFLKNKPSEKDVALANAGLEKIRNVLAKKAYDVVILDEVNVALRLKLLAIEDVLRLIKKAPPRVELILTGRYAHPEILKKADLISQIKELKHYFKKGVGPRKGIEF